MLILFYTVWHLRKLTQKSQEVVELLNDFFERLVTIVFKYDGVLDKYIGDCLMAAFGTLPDNRADAEYNAVCAALDFKVAIDEMNVERGRTGKAPISIGVGLNTGRRGRNHNDINHNNNDHNNIKHMNNPCCRPSGLRLHWLIAAPGVHVHRRQCEHGVARLLHGPRQPGPDHRVDI